MLFFYVRHGDPIYNPDSLTEQGKIQAEALSERFAYSGLDKIYSSSCIRAVQTAEPTCKKLNITCEKLDWAREDLVAQEFYGTTDDGNWTWCFFDKKIIKKFQTEEVLNLKHDWLNSECFKDTKFKQGFERVGKEADAFFLKLGYKHDLKRHAYKFIKHTYDKVALFAHGGFGMEFLSYILDIPYPEFCLKFVHLQTTGVVVIEFPENDESGYSFPRIVEYANDSHLYKNGLEPYHYLNKF